MMQTLSYLLALDIFALTALMMAVGPIAKTMSGARKRLTLALFFLVLLRSLALVGYLWGQNSLQGLIEVFSLICIVWALLNPAIVYLFHWRLYTWIGFTITSFFCLLLGLLPGFPQQPIIIAITLGGLPIILSRQDRTRWSHAMVPIILAGAALLDWLGLNTTSQLIALIGYGALIYAIFADTAISLDIRQQEVVALGAETQRTQAEQARFLEVSHQLNAAPNPVTRLNYAAQVIGQTVQVDQVTLLTFNDSSTGQVAAVYRNKQQDKRQEIPTTRTFAIADHPLLVEVLEREDAILIGTIADQTLLKKLYRLWNDSEIGPTMIQPLFLKKDPIGALILGNGLSAQSINNANIRLCRKLGSQLATMLAFNQDYQHLKSRLSIIERDLLTTRGHQDRFMKIIEALSDGVVVSDKHGRINLVNKTAETLLGQTRDQVINQTIGAVLTDGIANQVVERLTSEFSRSNRALPIYIERNQRSIQGHLIPLRHENQTWQGILTVLRDVTHEVRHDETKSMVIRTLSQELRTPLTTIKSYVDLMLAGAAGILDIQQRHFVQVIQAGTNRLENIMNESQLTLKKDTTLHKLNLSKVDIEEIIKQSRDNVAALLRAKNLSIALELPPTLPSLEADETMMRYILNNLLAGICQVSKESGTISICACIQAEGGNGYWTSHLVITIAGNVVLDNSPKASASDISKILSSQVFKPDIQVPDGLSDVISEQKLALVKEMVEAHGGRIWLENRANEGSVFQIALPYMMN